MQEQGVWQEGCGSKISFDSAFWLLRGKVYDATENHVRAVRAYRRALQLDPFCYEAFQVCDPDITICSSNNPR